MVSTSFMRRFSERARAHRRRLRRRTLVIGAVAVAVLAALAWVVLASPLLVVRHVEVSGTNRLAPAEVRAAVAASEGRPLARVDVASLQRAVTRLHGVRSADVGRSWPSTLDVRVTERVPLAAVPVEGGGFQVVDSDGVVLESVAEQPEGLPRVEVDVAAAGARTVQEVVAVLHSLPPELRAHVATAGATSRDSVTLGLDNGATVLWGSGDESPRKAKILEALLPTKAKVFDVSAPDLPVTRQQ
ncbi:MAG: cell division protein FtsQ/DivIB [Actinomycetes bacterium]